MEKSPTAFRTISEVSDALDVPAHVLRFWEQKFPQIRPVKRGGGRRYYRPEDVALLIGIRELLYDDGLTIKGVQKVLRERGPRHVVRRGANGAEAAGLDFGPDEAPETAAETAHAEEATTETELEGAPDAGGDLGGVGVGVAGDGADGAAAGAGARRGAGDGAEGDPEPPTDAPDAEAEARAAEADAARTAEARADDLAHIRSAITRLEALRDRLRADPTEGFRTEPMEQGAGHGGDRGDMKVQGGAKG